MLKNEVWKKSSMRISSLLFFHKQWNYGRRQNLIKTSLKCYTEKGVIWRHFVLCLKTNDWLLGSSNICK